MAEPFLSEIRLMSFSFAPKGWALCNGQLLPINQNQALFALLGTNFGGDGRVTFGLPDLQGRSPLHVGNGIVLGQKGGEAAHTLSIGEIPTHTHVLQATTTNADQPVPTGNMLATASGEIYVDPSALVAMAPATISTVGGSQPHSNMQPFLTLSYCIALQGIFPSPN
jgi:microcystin-dependent protein